MFLAVVILLLVTGGIAGSIYDKFHVVSELSQIEAHLKELDSDLDKTSNAVFKLKSELSGETNGKVESGDLVPLVPCVRPLDAWRTVLNGELKFTMKYLELAEDVRVTWGDTMTILPATFYELSGEIVGKFMNSSVTVPDNLTADSIIFMAATCGDNVNWQAYQFLSTGENYAHQVLSEDAMPVVETNTSEVVYNIGQDAFLRMRTRQPEHRAGHHIQTDVFLSLVDLKTGEFEMRPLVDYANKSVEFLDSKVDANSSEATIRMKMSERMKSGIIMTLSYQLMRGSVISFMSEFFHVYVRPSNQTGPFPPDYIHVRIPPHKQTDEKDITQEKCR
ncbi:unnamed protein product [Lymnaea stagnalis]|uniref:Uncharacterized protein n=1 Tax=Lymnaea stagnalis TaxID=6523 RepID=A0AAV2IFB9_LYMST